jgi:hypothetical protein
MATTRRFRAASSREWFSGGLILQQQIDISQSSQLAPTGPAARHVQICGEANAIENKSDIGAEMSDFRV